MSADVPSKQDQFQAFLDRGSVFVHLDPRRPGVVAPASITGRSRVVLHLRRALTIPLPDIEADDEAVRVTLSFGGVPFRCTLPWSAVFCLVADDGEVTMWPLELPPELAPERGPVLVSGGRVRHTEHPGRPVSLPPPGVDPATRSKSPTRAPLENAPVRSPSVIPGSLAAALRIPRAPALPKSLFAHEGDEAPADDSKGPDSTPAASRELRANDSVSLRPQNERGGGDDD